MTRGKNEELKMEEFVKIWEKSMGRPGAATGD